MNAKDAEIETEVRKLRAAVYGECSDGNWDACKDKWMEPENLKWLQQRQAFK